MQRRNFLIGTGAMGLATGLAGRTAIPISALGEDIQESLAIGTEPQLFLDDYCIERIEGLSRQLQHPQRLPEPVLDFKRFQTTQPYMSVIYDEQLKCYRMWYNLGRHIYHVDSSDAIHWDHPREVAVFIRAYGCCLIDDRERATDPARRFKMANWQATEKEESPEDDTGMWVGFSPDGFTWQFLDKPVLPMWPEGFVSNTSYVYQSVADIIDPYYDPIRKQYCAAVKQWSLAEDGYDRPRRLVAMTKSDDFVNWSKIWRIMSPDKQDEGETEFYGMGGVHARGSLLIGFVRVLRDDLAAEPDGPVQGIGYTTLATSRDGKTWTRQHETFLDRNQEPGTWDRAMTWVGAQIPVGDEVFLYYGGYSTGHKGGVRQIGMARMRKDGYVALHADEQGGALLTRPLSFQGNRLTLNINVLEGGIAQVEIQDLTGKPLQGFSKSECDAIRTDSTAHTVTWQGQSDVSTLTGQPVRLSIHLKSGDLYGFEFATHS